MKYKCPNCSIQIEEYKLEVKEDLNAKVEIEKWKEEQKHFFKTYLNIEKDYKKIIEEHNNNIEQIPKKFLGITWGYYPSEQRWRLHMCEIYSYEVVDEDGLVVLYNGFPLQFSFYPSHGKRYYKYIECPICKNRRYIK